MFRKGAAESAGAASAPRAADIGGWMVQGLSEGGWPLKFIGALTSRRRASQRRPFATVLVGTAIVAAGMAALAPRASAGNWVCSTRAIYSQAAGKYVSAELGWTGDFYGLLRARASTVGPWERFNVCEYQDGNYPSNEVWTIQSLANGLYVSAELGWTGGLYGLLRARASTVGPWEKFNLLADPSWSGSSLRSWANCKYVSAELGWTGEFNGLLRARADTVRQWERFSGPEA